MQKETAAHIRSLIWPQILIEILINNVDALVHILLALGLRIVPGLRSLTPPEIDTLKPCKTMCLTTPPILSCPTGMDSPNSRDSKHTNRTGSKSCTDGDSSSGNESGGECDRNMENRFHQEEATYAWLWRNQELADVSLEIVLTTAHAPNILCLEGTLRSESDSRTSSPADPHLALNTAGTAADQRPSAYEVITYPSRTKTFVLHSQVIGSNSAVLRASLASAMGSAKRKRASEDEPCRWPLHARMDAEDADAVEAVLEYFYTHQIERDILGSELVGMMKVR